MTTFKDLVAPPVGECPDSVAVGIGSYRDIKLAGAVGPAVDEVASADFIAVTFQWQRLLHGNQF